MKGSKQDGTLVVYNGQIYKGIEEIGFNHRDSFVLDLWTTDPADMRGGFFYIYSYLVRRVSEDSSYKMRLQAKW